MRKLLLGLVALVVVLVTAAFIVPSLIPADVYRAKIEETASQTLGRAVTVSGDVKISTFPSIQARASAVTIANESGFSAPSLAEVEELRATLAILPLLTGAVEIKEFVLVRPAIALEVDRAGRNNWTFASDASAAPSSSGDFKRQPGSLPFEAALGDLRIVDGSARYTDHASGESHTIADINLSLAMPGLSQPLTLDGGFSLDGDAVTLNARLDSLRSFFDGDAAPFDLTLNTGSLVVRADGQFDPGEDVRFSGDVEVASDDLRALAASVGEPLPDGDIFGRFSLKGHATGNADRLAFENADLRFDDITGTGGVVLNLAGAKPVLTGTLALGAVDVTPYMPEGGASSGGSGGVTPWSEEQIDLAALNMVDADFALTVTSLKARDFEFGRSNITARLRDGRLQIDLNELQAYEGAGTAQVVVNASSATPSYSLTADLANFQAQPFLRAAAQFTRLAGAGGGQISLSSRGNSQAEIMQALNGTGSFDFSDGVLSGIDVGAALQSAQQALQGDINLDAFNSNARTDFSNLLGQFTVENGVAHVRDFRATSEQFRMTGSGALNIAEQSLDLRLEPRAIAASGQDGVAGALSDISIPLRVSGSWGSVSAGVDQAALQSLLAARAQDEAVDAIGNAIGGDAGDLLRGVLGQPSAPSTDENGEEENAPDPTEALIQGLFGAIAGGNDDDTED